MKRRTFVKTTVGVVTLVTKGATLKLFGQTVDSAMEADFLRPPPDARLAVVWHWTGGVVTREGVTADLEGMAESGIDTVMWFNFEPSAGGGFGGGGGPETEQQDVQPEPPGLPQFSDEWWDMVNHMVAEANRLGLRIAPHVNSSWGPAGGPWITPELSQQTIVWTEMDALGGRPLTETLARPARPADTGLFGGRGGGPTPVSWDTYYRDLAVLAFPVPSDWGETSVTRNAKVTSSLPISDLPMAANPENTERVVDTDHAGWIQFSFEQPFTLRAVTVNPGGGGGGFPGFGGGGGQNASNDPYRTAHSMEVQASDDGAAFRKIGQLEPMYNSWQSGASVLTHSVTETTARHFRLVYNPGPPIGYDEGMRNGSRQAPRLTGLETDPEEINLLDEIDNLGFASIVLSSTPTVHHIDGKNASTWGRSRLVGDDEIPASSCVRLDSIVDLSDRLQADGTIEGWTPPAGNWRVMRFGFTTQGRTSGGGLQCDKFSADAARVQFHGWFGRLRREPEGAGQVMKVLNIDSWEAQSQNWSPVLRAEFRARRGYDCLKFLPAMAGVLVESPSVTEAFLLDARRTMAECIADNFYGTMQRLCHERGVEVTTESVCPTMNADGVEVYKNVDHAGSEFWVRASQNWKPNDIAEAASGGHIYGKKIIFTEAFTGGGWPDYPFALKAMGDHHYAEGINRMMLHVWNEQYMPDRAPGIPGAGTPFNQLNTWWEAGRGWCDYMVRCQALLQQGRSVVDAVYFTGENLPSRALVAPRFGWCFAAEPVVPDGYKFDSINRDALLNLAKVEDGQIVLPSGMRYRVLVLREEDTLLSPRVAEKIRELVEKGATVVAPKPTGTLSLEGGLDGAETVRQIGQQVWGDINGTSITENRFGEGRVIWGKPMAEVLSELGVEPDVQFINPVASESGQPVVADMNARTGSNPVLVGAARKGWGMEFNHRHIDGRDLYFLSNQEFFPVSTEVSFRVSGRVPELWHADTGKVEDAPVWREDNGRTIIPLDFDPAGSVFVAFERRSDEQDPVVEVSGGKAPGLRLEQTASGLEAWAAEAGKWNLRTRSGRTLTATVTDVAAPEPVEGAWNVSFPVKGTDKHLQLEEGSWTNHSDSDVKHFSGTATYSKEIILSAGQLEPGRRLVLDLGDVQQLVRVLVNGHDLGVLWKAPYVADITAAAREGVNQLELEVTNTWVNRLIGDAGLPQAERTTYLPSGGRGRDAMSPDSPLQPAGLIGPVRLRAEVNVTPVAG